MNSTRINEIKQYGKLARGQKEYIQHLEGHYLTLRQAVYARCYDCMGYFADGKIDCNTPHCPLHPFMAYNKERVKRTTNRTLTAKLKQKMIEVR